MRKPCLIPLLFFFSIIILLPGCIKKHADNKPCLSFTKSPVTKVEGPVNALVNQDVILTVSFQCFNGCGQFGNFDQVHSGNTTTVSVTAKYEGCVCTQDIPIRQITYKFRQSQTGTFEIKFLQTGNTYLTHTINVQ